MSTTLQRQLFLPADHSSRLASLEFPPQYWSCNGSTPQIACQVSSPQCSLVAEQQLRSKPRNFPPAGCLQRRSGACSGTCMSPRCYLPAPSLMRAPLSRTAYSRRGTAKSEGIGRHCGLRTARPCPAARKCRLPSRARMSRSRHASLPGQAAQILRHTREKSCRFLLFDPVRSRAVYHSSGATLSAACNSSRPPATDGRPSRGCRAARQGRVRSSQ